jgi:hypothetical protein
MPIQRIPRYVMLLEDLLKHTPNPHVDYENLAAALNKMKEVAITINEKKREVESFAIVIDIYNRLEPKLQNLCEAHRHLLKEGVLKESGKPYMFFLFNDILLKTKEMNGGKQLKMLLIVQLKTANVSDVADNKQNSILDKKCLKIFFLSE